MRKGTLNVRRDGAALACAGAVLTVIVTGAAIGLGLLIAVVLQSGAGL